MTVIEIINTGSELLLGRVANSHQQWLCRRLADLGYFVRRQVTVGDQSEAIKDAVADALKRADLILTTGGLGPTSDDLTRQAIAALAGKKLLMDERVRAAIEQHFRSRGKTAPAGVEVQALVPEGALIFDNAHGTAPGLALQIHRSQGRPQPPWLVMLPGPPRELYPMFNSHVLSFLSTHFPRDASFSQQILRVTGLGESHIEERIRARLEPLVERGLDLGYCARVGEVDIRLLATGPGSDQIVAEAARSVQESIGPFIFGTGEETLESVVVRMLMKAGRTVALAESCTGGYLAHRITNVPGASRVLSAAFVTYASEAKQSLLGVRPETLAFDGAVSDKVASEMAEGVRLKACADYGLAVTGIAGPGGGSERKPVGTVFVGLAAREGTQVVKQLNAYDRETFKFVTSQQALELLRRELLAECLGTALAPDPSTTA